MSYAILLDSRVQKDLRRIEAGALRRIDAVIRSLAKNPHPAGCTRLQGRLREGWRVRVGDYRILYHIYDDRKEVVIYKVGHRREVYR